MARIFYQQDCDLQKLSGKTVAIIGYGSQGHAHALNLKDSGVDVIVGLYEGSKSWAKAEKQGLKVMTSAEAAKNAELKKQKHEEETDGAEKHPLVKDKRFLSLSYFPNVIPDCFKECEG